MGDLTRIRMFIPHLTKGVVQQQTVMDVGFQGKSTWESFQNSLDMQL